MGISERILTNSVENLSPDIFGIAISVITIPNLSGFARKVYRASTLLICEVTWYPKRSNICCSIISRFRFFPTATFSFVGANKIWVRSTLIVSIICNPKRFENTPASQSDFWIVGIFNQFRSDSESIQKAHQFFICLCPFNYSGINKYFKFRFESQLYRKK